MMRNAWLIPLIPAVSFFLILFFGKKLPRKGSEIGVAALLASFALALGTAAQWLGQRSGYQAHAIGQPGAASGRHGNQFSKRARAMNADDLALWAQIFLPHPAQRTLAAAAERVHDHAVADCQIGDIRSNSSDRAGELVAHDQWRDAQAVLAQVAR